jgi:hypothetical protein
VESRSTGNSSLSIIVHVHSGQWPLYNMLISKESAAVNYECTRVFFMFLLVDISLILRTTINRRKRNYANCNYVNYNIWLLTVRLQQMIKFLKSLELRCFVSLLLPLSLNSSQVLSMVPKFNEKEENLKLIADTIYIINSTSSLSASDW